MAIDITKTLKEKGLFVSSEPVDGLDQRKIKMKIPEGITSQKELAEFLAQEYVNQSNYKKKRFVLLKEAPSCFITVVDRGEFYSGTIDKFNCIDTIQFSETHQKMDIPTIYRKGESKYQRN